MPFSCVCPASIRLELSESRDHVSLWTTVPQGQGLCHIHHGGMSQRHVFCGSLHLAQRSADKGLLTDRQLRAKAPNKSRNLIRWRKRCLSEVTVSLSPRHTQTGMYALASISAALQLPAPLSLTEKSLPVLHSGEIAAPSNQSTELSWEERTGSLGGCVITESCGPCFSIWEAGKRLLTTPCLTACLKTKIIAGRAWSL